MDELSAEDYNDMVEAFSALDNVPSTSEAEEEIGLPNVEQCKEEIAEQAKVGAVAGGIGAVLQQAVSAVTSTAAATWGAVVTGASTVVAVVAGGAATGAATAAMTSEACAAAPQELADFVNSLDPTELEKQMERISLVTAPQALEGRR